MTRKSNGNLRVCIDPNHLNVALERERYPMKTIEDILPKLQKCKVFSVADRKSGYWHVQLNDESRSTGDIQLAEREIPLASTTLWTEGIS